MSTKLKSEKTKVKFAQSNINHVYKGSSTEPHHKPTIRQYGMQVVGKLQGTRRLPPPAWIPSIKAETGGLDTRVAIVPAGGSGWGAPPVTNTSTESIAPFTDVGAVTTSWAYSVNGTYSDSVNTLTSTNVDTDLTKSIVDKSHSKPSDSFATGSFKTTVGEFGTSSTSKTPVEKSNSGGGLAANKPFFQRPVPVTTNTNNIPNISTTVDSSNKLGNQVKFSGGAREIVGEPTGWAAIDQEEPDFDEHILFSDEEDTCNKLDGLTSCAVTTVSDCKSTAVVTNPNSSVIAHFPEQIDTSRPPPPLHLSTNELPVGTGRVGAFPPQMKPFFSGHDSLTAQHGKTSILPQNSHMDNSNMVISQSWTNTNDLGFGIKSTSFMSKANPHFGTNAGASFAQSNVSTHGHSENFYQNSHGPSLLQTPVSSNLLDLQQSTFIGTELQAQRHARTEEFKTAVERAQQARASQLKQSELSVGSNQPLSKQCDFSDCRTSGTTLNANAPNQTGGFPFPANLPVSQILNSIPPHLLFPLAGYSPEMVTAFAVATVAAMAYSSGNDKSGSLCASSNSSVYPQATVTATSKINTNNLWSAVAPFVSGASTSTAIAGIFSKPKMSQILQNVLSATVSSNQSQSPKGNLPPQSGMCFDPDFERFVELLNQQQSTNRMQPVSFKNASDSAVQAPRTFNMDISNNSDASFVTDVNKHVKDQSLGNCNITDSFSSQSHMTYGKIDKIGQRFRSNTESLLNPTDTLNCGNMTSSGGSLEHSLVNEESLISQRSTNRVPGLMDVEVSCASSQHLAELWEKEDYLLDSGYRGYRGRGKHSAVTTVSCKIQRGAGGNNRGSIRAQYSSDSVVHDFKSMSLHGSVDKSLLSDDMHHYSYNKRSQNDSKSVRNWSTTTTSTVTTLHSAVSTASSSVNVNTNVLGSRGNNTEDVGGWNTQALNNMLVTSNESQSDANDEFSDDNSMQKSKACGKLKSAKPCVSIYKEEDDGDDREPGDNADDGSADPKDSMKTHRSDYNGVRRPRRSRAGQNAYFTSSNRIYGADDYPVYPSRYSKGFEYDYYPRQQYPTSGTKTNHNVQPSTNSSYGNQRKNRSNVVTVSATSNFGNESVQRSTVKGGTNSTMRGGHHSGTLSYYGNRSSNARSLYQYDQGNDYYYYSNLPQDMKGRSTRSQSKKVPYSKSQFTSNMDYYSNDYQYSDGEIGGSNAKSHNYRRISEKPGYDLDTNTNPHRNRSHESNSGATQKGYRKNVSNTKNKNYSGVGDQSSISNDTSGDVVFSKPTALLEDPEDVDIPTIRVPAQESVRQLYPRNSRLNHKTVSSMPKRTNFQSKKNDYQYNYDGGTRRYREMRDRYNDEKDGDDGAAGSGAGGGSATSGAGRSGTYGINSGGVSSKDGDSGNGGTNSNTGGGNGNTDGHADSLLVDSNQSNLGESEISQHNNSNRSRQLLGTNKSHCSRNRQYFNITNENVSDVNENDQWETASEGFHSSNSKNDSNRNSSLTSLSSSLSSFQSPLSCENIKMECDGVNLINLPSNKDHVIKNHGLTSSVNENDPCCTGLLLENTDALVANETTDTCQDNQLLQAFSDYDFDRLGDVGDDISVPGNGFIYNSQEDFVDDDNNASAVVTSIESENVHLSRHDKPLTGDSKSQNNTKQLVNTVLSTGIDISSIPPLMSIKTEGSFNHKSQLFGSLSTWRYPQERRFKSYNGDRAKHYHDKDVLQSTRNNNITNATTYKSTSSNYSSGEVASNQNEPNDNELDNVDKSSLNNDGFTEVVSKASRNLARRRLQDQQQSSALSGNGGHRSKYDSLKENSYYTRSNDAGSKWKTTKNIKYLGQQSHLSNSSKMTPKKRGLVASQHLTFMGPPMCTEIGSDTNAIPTTSSSRVTTLHPNDATSTCSMVAMRSTPVSTSRTWSKVVGTKSIFKTAANGNSDANNSRPVATAFLVGNSNSIWESNKTTSLTSEASACQELNKQELQNNAVSSSQVVRSSHPSVQSLWSTKNGSVGGDVANLNSVVSSGNDDRNNQVQDTCPDSVCTEITTVVNTTVVTTTVTTTTICNLSNTKLISSSVEALSAVSPSITQSSNNICKVKPQQQQNACTSHSSSSLSNNLLTKSVSNHATSDLSTENERSDFESANDLNVSNKLQQQQHHPNVIFKPFVVPRGGLLSTWSSSVTSGGGVMYPQSATAQSSLDHSALSQANTNTNSWPVVDQNNLMDPNVAVAVAAASGSNHSSYHHPHHHHHHPQSIIGGSSNVLSSIFASNSSMVQSNMDGLMNQYHQKQSALNMTTPPPSFARHIQHIHQAASVYAQQQHQSQQPSLLSSDPLGMFSNGGTSGNIYGGAPMMNDYGKLSPHSNHNSNVANNSNTNQCIIPFVSNSTNSIVGGGLASMYLTGTNHNTSHLHPQSSRSHPHIQGDSGVGPLSIPVIQSNQKCRQRVNNHQHPIEQMNYANYLGAVSVTTGGYPGDIHNDYNLTGGYIQPASSVGLYSALHAQTPQNYPQSRPAMGSYSSGNHWSFLGNPTPVSSVQGVGQSYVSAVGTGVTNGVNGSGGLLPHPILPPHANGYGNVPCHYPTSIASNPAAVSNYTSQSSYVGVIGGGRPGADHSGVVASTTASRQRGLQHHHNLYGHHPNLPQSPSSQGQQSFQLHTGFYPSLSPSHQRVSLHQPQQHPHFVNSQSRTNLVGHQHLNSQTGLYAAAFGGGSGGGGGVPQQTQNQSTPPPIAHQLNPINFLNNPFQYPSRPDGLH